MHMGFLPSIAAKRLQSDQLCHLRAARYIVEAVRSSREHLQQVRPTEMEAATASGSKADEVIALLKQVLQEVDMSITTQRQVINKLAEALGEEVYEFKALIKVGCESCLSGSLDQQTSQP